MAAGEVHGFLGPNGSGKSTTIRIVLGLMRATGGRAELFGGDPWHDAATLHARVAYVPGDVALWPSLTGGQCLDVLGVGQRRARAKRRRAALVEMFDLDPTKRIRDYSKGNRQKVALIAAFAAEAELLVLDEPTSGLDPLMEQAFQAVRARAARGGRHGAAVEPHPRRGRGPRRPGHHHPPGPHRQLRQPGRPAAAHQDPGARRDRRAPAGLVDVRRRGGPDRRRGAGSRRSRGSPSTPSTSTPWSVSCTGRSITTLTVTPPSLDALFLRNYDEARGRRPAIRRGGATMTSRPAAAPHGATAGQRRHARDPVAHPAARRAGLGGRARRAA